MFQKATATFLMSVMFCLPLFATSQDDIHKWQRPKTVPQPKNNPITPQKVKLGKLLYFDTRLSSNNQVSCATCHHPKRGWTDQKVTSRAVGVANKVGTKNSPTILNTAFGRHQFWDGRAKSLEQQALGPIQSDVEMSMPLDKLSAKLNKIKGYKKLFQEAFQTSEITPKNIAKAIASFERTIITPDAPFDKYIKGDTNALTKEQKEGFALFKGKAHCVDCHDGWNFTDGSFQNIGLYDGDLPTSELGRYALKPRASWYGAFKTPTLRNVTKTYPYFHDGSVKTLKEATVICSRGGRFEHNVRNLSTAMKDRHLTQEEIDKLIVFMHALTSPDLNITIPTKFPQ